MTTLDETLSLCPVCLRRIPAKRTEAGEHVYLVKNCPEHGHFKTLIWDGYPAYRAWKRPKLPTTPPVTRRSVAKGCPFDCGLCPDHRQRSCTILLEVTGRCNLFCSFCYANAGGNPCDPDLKTIKTWYRSAADASGGCNIQLSGGEPTLRDDLPDIVAMGREHGFSFVQLNTNGIRLAKDQGFLRNLRDAGLNSVFLQFDGVTPRVHEMLRGRRLVEEKLAAVSACHDHGIGVVLVPTLVPGINTDEIGALIQKAMSLSPAVRGIHFQPVSYFGRFPRPPANRDRLTLPRLMRLIESQTAGLLTAGDFKPPGCENALCSFHASYLLMADAPPRLLGENRSCCDSAAESAAEGAARTIARVAKQWSIPSGPAPGNFRAPGIQSSGELPSLDSFLGYARQNTFSVSSMAFQDVWNLDLDRLRDCCIHVMKPSGELVPFCAYNLTAMDGGRLYR